MDLEKFYTAIRLKSEPQTFAEANEDSLTYGTRRYLKLFRTKGHKSLFISQIFRLFFRAVLVFISQKVCISLHIPSHMVYP